MTNKQKQCLLVYMDCLPASGIDDIWGPQSMQATKRMQQKLGVPDDGNWGSQTTEAVREFIYSGADLPDMTDTNVGSEVKTGTWWAEIEFFDREEFRCQCGGKYCNGFHVEPDETMVRTVDEIRRRLGVPVSIVDAGGSGVRCPRHNANVGGVPNSLHVRGEAADLHSSKSPQEMYQVAEEVLGNTGELGRYSWGIHVGVNCKYSRFNG